LLTGGYTISKVFSGYRDIIAMPWSFSDAKFAIKQKRITGGTK